MGSSWTSSLTGCRTICIGSGTGWRRVRITPPRSDRSRFPVIPAGGDPSSGTINIVGLSLATGVPKGTVSKRVQRLVDLGVVARRRLAGNRKEVHLQLTDVGQEIQAAHRDLHQQMGAVPDEFLERYSLEELKVITRVLNDLVRMPREGVRFRPDLLD